MTPSERLHLEKETELARREVSVLREREQLAALTKWQGGSGDGFEERMAVGGSLSGDRDTPRQVGGDNSTVVGGDDTSETDGYGEPRSVITLVRLSKFTRMMRQRVPRRAIVRQLSADGVSESEQKEFFHALDGQLWTTAPFVGDSLGARLQRDGFYKPVCIHLPPDAMALNAAEERPYTCGGRATYCS